MRVCACSCVLSSRGKHFTAQWLCYSQHTTERRAEQRLVKRCAVWGGGGRIKNMDSERQCANQKSAKLSRHVERLWQPHCIYMSINKSGNKIKRNKYMTRAVRSESFFEPRRERNYSSRWSTPFMSEIKTTTKKSQLASREVFCMKASPLKKKKIQKTNICFWTRCALLGSLLYHLQSGAWLCLIKCVCISHRFLFFLGKAATVWEKKHEEESQVKMSVLSSCLLLSDTSAVRYEIDTLIRVNLVQSWLGHCYSDYSVSEVRMCVCVYVCVCVWMGWDKDRGEKRRQMEQKCVRVWLPKRVLLFFL